MLKILNNRFVQIFAIFFAAALLALTAFCIFRGGFDFSSAEREESKNERMTLPLEKIPEGYICLDSDLHETDGAYMYIQNTETKAVYKVGLLTMNEVTYFLMTHEDGTYMTVDEIREQESGT